jgi:tetratricopeptide (TPR) repeat protein
MLAAVFIMLAAGTAAYSNSFSGPFVFDGATYIERNPQICSLWPPWGPMTGTARPIAAWSFAVNYALGGTKPWGYHAVNLAIHLAAALVLFGIIRRTLSSGRLAARFAKAACGLALAVAVLWLVHPLQTQSVTYIYQRFESLMGLFMLWTLYSFVRAQDSSAPKRWYVASAAGCLLAVASKEVAAVTPLLVLWYDRALVASSWREISRRRWAYYLALAGTWLVLAGLMLSRADKFAEAGVLAVKNLTPWQYAASQPGVIAHYLRLCFWPTGLCIDYGWPVAHTILAIIPPLLLIAALLALTARAIYRWPAWSFLGAWFFLILAPTSSVFPIRDLAFEHRMYLPLAAVTAGIVVGGWVAGQWLVGRGIVRASVLPILGGALVLSAGAALGFLTLERNGNARAHNNLGAVLVTCGQLDEAIAHCRKALEIHPDYAEAHSNLGLALARRGQFDEANEQYQQALKLEPNSTQVMNNLAWLRATCPEATFRNGARAIELAGRAVELSGGQNPNYLDTLAAAQAEAGRFSEAVETARKALELATQQNQPALAKSIEPEISLYKAGTPFRTTPQPPVARSIRP